MRFVRWTATGILAVALIVNAVIHLRLAAPFDAVAGTIVTQGDLFRIQAVSNIVAIAVLVIARRRWADALALVIAAGGAALIVVTALVPLDLTAEDQADLVAFLRSLTGSPPDLARLGPPTR